MKIALLALCAAFGLSGCMDMDFGPGVKGSGKLATDERAVGDYSRIESHGAFDVKVTIGPKSKVKIEGDDNLLPLVETRVENGVLVLDSKENLRPTKGLKVTLSVPKLDSLALLGAGDIRIEGLKQDRFDLTLKGAGDVLAAGTVRDLSIDLKGAGDLDLYELKADNVDASVSGAGDLELYAARSLKAKVSGVGDIRYRGKPEKIERNVSGMGKISASD